VTQVREPLLGRARVFVQSRRLDDVSDVRGSVRDPGLQYRDAHHDPDCDAAPLDGHQQGHRRRAARIACRRRGDAARVRPAGRRAGGLVLLIGIDAFLDMGRTMTNVIGNGVATAVVAKWENELGEPVEENTEFLQTVAAG
jgi:hypothetical protein